MRTLVFTMMTEVCIGHDGDDDLYFFINLCTHLLCILPKFNLFISFVYFCVPTHLFIIIIYLLLLSIFNCIYWLIGYIILFGYIDLLSNTIWPLGRATSEVVVFYPVCRDQW